jgi:hypothetical protein
VKKFVFAYDQSYEPAFVEPSKNQYRVDGSSVTDEFGRKDRTLSAPDKSGAEKVEIKPLAEKSISPTPSARRNSAKTAGLFAALPPIISIDDTVNGPGAVSNDWAAQNSVLVIGVFARNGSAKLLTKMSALVLAALHDARTSSDKTPIRGRKK